MRKYIYIVYGNDGSVRRIKGTELCCYFDTVCDCVGEVSGV